jgi:hypothetical protein
VSEDRARPSEVVVRDATPDDDAALCDLFARITMDGDLRVSVERSPEFFKLYGLQRLNSKRVFVAEVQGSIEGVASFLVRDGWLEGEHHAVGYLGDLRLSPRIRGGFFFGRRFGAGLRECFEGAGVEVATTAILGSNAVAIRFLTKRSKRFADKPVYRPWTSFDILNLHFARKKRPRTFKGLTVRTASEPDLAAIASLLSEDQRRREFGYVIDEALLRTRLESWPGLNVEDFRLAYRNEELVGVAAPWDAYAVKRMVVLEYRGSMRWIRAGFNLGSLFFRYPPLPPVGKAMRYAYLTHVAIKNDDPDVMSALVDQIYCDLHGTGLNFLTVYRQHEDPLSPAFAPYQSTPIPAQLFTVSLAGSRFNDWDPGPQRPGFEMALV